MSRKISAIISFMLIVCTIMAGCSSKEQNVRVLTAEEQELVNKYTDLIGLSEEDIVSIMGQTRYIDDEDGMYVLHYRSEVNDAYISFDKETMTAVDFTICGGKNASAYLICQYSSQLPIQANDTLLGTKHIDFTDMPMVPCGIEGGIATLDTYSYTFYQKDFLDFKKAKYGMTKDEFIKIYGYPNYIFSAPKAFTTLIYVKGSLSSSAAHTKFIYFDENDKLIDTGFYTEERIEMKIRTLEDIKQIKLGSSLILLWARFPSLRVDGTGKPYCGGYLEDDLEFYVNSSHLCIIGLRVFDKNGKILYELKQ